MDPRLEVASEVTFETYLWLHKAMNEGRPGWSEVVERMGGPSILLDHAREFGAEATLLADPRWRCVYFDSVASVFLESGRNDLETSFRTIDFAAQHFLSRRASLLRETSIRHWGSCRGWSAWANRCRGRQGCGSSGSRSFC